MTALSEQECEACRADAPKISDADLKVLMPNIPIVVVDMVGAILEVIATDTDEEYVILIETEFIYCNGRSTGHFLFLSDKKSKVEILELFKADKILAGKSDE